MSNDRIISSNTFGAGTRIHQGDTVIHNYSPNASRKAYYVLPFPPNEDIIRRPEIVTKLDKLLSPSKEGQYCSAALWGLGGSGKTQIALDYAYRRSHKDPDCDIFWVHADNETSFAQDYQKIARKLGLDRKLNGEELFLEVKDHIEKLQRWLLILDNADDVTRFGVGVTGQNKSLIEYIPRGPGGTVIWTSRDEQIVDLVGPLRGVQITRMDIEEAVNLLLTTARKENIKDHEIQDARLLLQELQWLPLAISQAGSYMRRTLTPIKTYLSRLLEGKSRWYMLKKTQHDKHRRPDVSNSVLETWNISIQHIRKESEMTYRVLHTIAYLDSENIPFSVILAASTASDQPEQEKPSANEDEVVETVIVRLKDFSFISARKAENDDEPSFDMHKLVQEAIRYRLNTADITLEAHFSSTALSVIANLFPEEIKPETWPHCEKYATHAIRVSEWAEMSEDVAITSEFLWRAADYFYKCESMKRAEHMTKKVLNLEKKAVGEEHPTLLLFTSRLTTIYISQQRYKKAEMLTLKSLTLAEKNFGGKSDAVIILKDRLALLYQYQGQNEKAEELQVKMLSLRQEVDGEKHLQTILATSLLASTYEEQGRYDQAIELRVRVVALYSEVLGEKHPTTVDSIGELADTYELASHPKKAEELRFKLLSLGQDFPWEQYTEPKDMKKLATSFFQRGLNSKARSVQKKILSFQREHLGEKNLVTARTMEWLATEHIEDGEYREAAKIQLKALALYKEFLGNKHDRTLSAMGAVAYIYYLGLLIDEGEKFELEAVSLLREVYGDKLPLLLRFQFDNLPKVRMVASKEVEELRAENLSTRKLFFKFMAYKLSTWTGQLLFTLLCLSVSFIATTICNSLT